MIQKRVGFTAGIRADSKVHVTKNCLSHVLEQSRTGRHSALTNSYKNIPERSIS